MLSPMSRAHLSAAVLLAWCACLQLFVFVPDGFFTGDQGTKLLQTRATLLHGPLHPWIDALSRDVDPGWRHLDPLLLVRADNGRLVGLFPWALPTVTAPFYRQLGLYGLYVVPALAMAIAFGAAVRLGRALGTSGLISGWCAVAATPLLFYGAEFWEHAPAAALTTVATGLAIPSGSRTLRRYAIAGSVLAAAALFRPEAAVMAPAIVAGVAAAGGVRAAWRPGVALASGFVIVTLLAIPVNIAVYGAAVPPHVSSNLAIGWAHYMATRRAIVGALLLPAWGGPLFVVAAIAALVSSVWLSDSTRVRSYVRWSLVGIFLFLGFVAPAIRWAFGQVSPLIAFNPASIAHTWPFAIVLLYPLPVKRSSPAWSVVRYLLVVIGVFVLLVFAVAPHEGGAQWGARFLLPAAPLAAVLASLALTRTDAAAAPARLRAEAAVLLVISLAVQGVGLAVLARHKAAHARIAAVVEARTRPGDTVVSDLYWVPELLARLYESRRVLYAPTAPDLDTIATHVADVGLRRVVYVTSTEESERAAPGAIAPAAGIRFIAGERVEIGVRGLNLIVYERDAEPPARSEPPH